MIDIPAIRLDVDRAGFAETTQIAHWALDQIESLQDQLEKLKQDHERLLRLIS